MPPLLDSLWCGVRFLNDSTDYGRAMDGMVDTLEFVAGKRVNASAGGSTPLSITCHVCQEKVPMSSLDAHMKVGMPVRG
jgi:hypothetical protein